jgi:hypothetical protein
MWANFITFAVSAAGGGGGNSSCVPSTFFGLKPWYYYLSATPASGGSGCDVAFNALGNGKNSDILLVLLAIVDDLLIIAGLVAVGYVIFAGVKYITSQGSPDETAKAQSTLVNALLGLALALVAITLVSFLGNKLGGASGGSPGVSGIDVSSLPKTPATAATVKNILTIVFSVVGALALLFITIGGFRYVLSQGDAQATGKAKNTILYALIGLMVAIMGQVIVTFVIGRIT